MKPASLALRALALAGIVLLARQPAAAKDVIDYGPVPPRIEAVIADKQEQALAVMAMGLLDQADRPGPMAPTLEWPRALLVMLDDVGLKTAATRLAQPDVPDIVKRELLAIVGASDHPDADLLLSAAAKEPAPVMRMLAAQGLGRGRTAQAVPVLETLAQDKRSGVRAAAMRALFAIPTPQARAARVALPVEDVSQLMRERLRRHRQVDDAGPELRPLALAAYGKARNPGLRLEAARLLALPASETSLETLERIVTEMGTDPLGAAYVRHGLGVPFDGYDSVTERRAAITAAFTILGRKDAPAELRRRMLALAVHWVADPVDMDSRGREPMPEEVVRRYLPEVGAELIPHVLARLAGQGFSWPALGPSLLRDLGPSTALPVFHQLMRDEDPHIPHGDVAYVLSQWGRIGDEAVARELLSKDYDAMTRASLIQALTHEPAAWALPMLSTELVVDDVITAHAARSVLERRPEPEARQILITDLFERAHKVDQNMPPLVHPIDDVAWGVLERALKDPRYKFAHEALAILAKPKFRSKRGRALLAPLVPDLGYPKKVQDYVYALVNQDALESVRFVREQWANLPQPYISLRQLQEVWGAAAKRGAVDLALNAVRESTDQRMLAAAAAVISGKPGHRDADVRRLWLRMLNWPKDDLRTSALIHAAYRGCPDISTRLIFMLEAARKRRGLLRDSNEMDEASRAQHVLGAMRFQPWAKVENAIINTVLDPHAHPEVRQVAARVAQGRVSDGARRRLLLWLAGSSAPANAQRQAPRGAGAEGALQLIVAEAVGRGGDGTAAGRLYWALMQEHMQFYAVPSRLDPSVARKTAFQDRVCALATGVVRTGHEPSIHALGMLLFMPHYSTYASRAVAYQSSHVARGGPGAGSAGGVHLDYALHRTLKSYKVLAPEAAALVAALRHAGDDVLVTTLRTTLDGTRNSGLLATFPDLYLHRIAQTLADGSDAPANPKAAAVVASYGRRLLPVRGPADFALLRQRVQLLEQAKRFGEAAELQREVLQIIAQRGYDDAEGRLWTIERTRLDNLAGCDFAQRGLKDLAHDAFRRASLRAPEDPWPRMASAVARAHAGFDLTGAEVDARRALKIHARTRNEPDLPWVDQLAQVLLAAGKPGEAADALEPHLDRKSYVRRGMYYVHLAKAYLAIGEDAAAARALVQALSREQGLEARIFADAAFKAWRQNGRLGKIAAAARRNRIEGY